MNRRHLLASALAAVGARFWPMGESEKKYELRSLWFEPALVPDEQLWHMSRVGDPTDWSAAPCDEVVMFEVWDRQSRTLTRYNPTTGAKISEEIMRDPFTRYGVDW